MADVGSLDFSVRYDDKPFREGIKRTEAEAKAFQARLDRLNKIGVSGVKAKQLLDVRDNLAKQIGQARQAAAEQSLILERARKKDIITERKFQKEKIKLAKSTSKKIHSIESGGIGGAAGLKGLLGRIGGGVASGAIISGIISIGKASIKAAAQSEKSLASLRATAKLTGNDFADLKTRVAELGKDGAVGINQLSTSLSLLINQGFSADKAAEILQATKAVATFNSASGDAAQGVADLTNGLLTGEEQLFNIDPSLKQFAKSLGGGEKVAGDFATKLQFVNEIISRAKPLADDYSKSLEGLTGTQNSAGVALQELEVSLGEVLAPVLVEVAGAMKYILDAFASVPRAIKTGIVAFAAVGSAMLAIIPIAAAFQIAITGPVGLAVAAAAGLAAGLVSVVNILTEVDKRKQDQLDLDEQLRKSQENIEDENKSLSEKNAAIAQQSKLLSTVPELYREEYRASIKANEPLIRRLELLQRIREEQDVERETESRLDELRQMSQEERDSLRAKIKEGKDIVSGHVYGDVDVVQAGFIPAQLGLDYEKVSVYDFEEGLIVLERRLDETEKATTEASAAQTKYSGGLKQHSDFLLNNLEKTIAANNKAYKDFLSSAEGKGKAAEGEAKRIALNAEAIRQASIEIEQYYKTDLENEIQANNEAAAQQQKAFAEREKQANRHAAKSEDIEKARERKELEIKLKAAEQTAQALSQVNSAAIALIQSQGRAQTIGAVGGLAGAVGGLAGSAAGVAAGIGGAAIPLGIGAIGLGIASAIFGAVDAADEERKRKEKARIEEIERKKQAAYQTELARIKTKHELEKLSLVLTQKLFDLEKDRRDLLVKIRQLDAKSETEKLQLAKKESDRLLSLAIGAKSEYRPPPTSTPQAGVNDIGNRPPPPILMGTLVLGRKALMPPLAPPIVDTMGGNVIDESGGEGITSKQFGFISTTNTRKKDKNLYEKLSKFGELNTKSQVNTLFRILQIKEKEKTARERLAIIITSITGKKKGKATAGFESLKKFLESSDGNYLTPNEYSALADAYIKENQAAVAGVGAGLDRVGIEIGRIQSTITAAETSATLGSQIQTQKYQDRVANIDLLAQTAEQTGQTYDKAGALKPIFDEIKKVLGIEDFANISQELIKSFGTSGTQYEQFSLLLDLNRQIADSTKSTAENTALKPTGDLNIIDIASGLVRIGDNAVRFPSIALDDTTSKAIDLLTSKKTDTGNDTLGSIDATLKEIRDLTAVLVEIQSVDPSGAEGIILQRALDAIKRRTVA